LMIKRNRLRWFGLYEHKMTMTGSNVVSRGRLKELDREDPQKDHVGLC